MANGWFQGTDGTWTLINLGALRYTLMAGVSQAANTAVRLDIADPAYGVGGIVLSSPDGRTCYEVYTTGGTGGNIRIRKVTLGVAAAHVATAAHGLTTAVLYTMEIRVLQGVIQVRLNGASTAILTYTVPAGDECLEYNNFGASGITNGGKVLRMQICSLILDSDNPLEVLAIVAGGELWCSTDGVNVFRVDPRAMNDGARVSMADFEQKIYMVDGSRAAIFDPATLAVTAHILTAGTWPGAQSGVDGSTSFSLVESHIGRLWYSGSRFDPQNIYATAINDPLDLDTGSDLPGAAFALSAASTAKIGQPVVGLFSTSKSRLLVGCSGSIWEIIGDPTLFGAVDVNPLTRDYGLAGKDAWTMANEGMVVGYSRAGVFAIADGGLANIISDATLSILPFENISWLTEGTPQVIRDVDRNGTHIFLTKNDATSTHLWLDERLNGLSPKVGGYFPEKYPDPAGPTCSVIFRGRVLLGGRDGYIRRFDDATKYDDRSVTINWQFPMGVVVDGDLKHDTIMESGELILGERSDAVNLTVYEAATPEAAYGVLGTNARVPRYSITTTNKLTPLSRRARGGAIVCVISSSVVNKRGIFEAMQVTTTPVNRLHRQYTTSSTSSSSTSSSSTSSSNTDTGPETTVTTASTAATTGTTLATSHQTSATTAQTTAIDFTATTPPVDETNTTASTFGTCESCETWMMDHTVNEVGGAPAYVVWSASLLELARDKVDAFAHFIATQGICGISSYADALDIVLYVDHVGDGHATPELITIANFLAQAPDPDWKAITYFRCVDQS